MKRPVDLRPSDVLERYGLLILLGLIILFFSLNENTSQFASTANVRNVLSNEAVGGIIAIATVLPLVAGHFDLSIGPNAGLTALITAGMMARTGVPLAGAMVVGALVGVAIGLVNAVLVGRLRLNSIVATLGTASIISALVQVYSDGVSIAEGVSEKAIDFGTGTFLGLPLPFFLLLAVGLLAWYALEQTPPGRNLYAAGASERAASLVGISVPRYVFWSFVASGAIGGVAGVLLLSVQGGADPLNGPNYTLPAVAAVFLGATAIKPGRYNIAGTVVAVFFLAGSVNGLTLWGVAGWVSDLYVGVALILAVAIATWSGRRRLQKPSATDESEPVGSDLAPPDVRSRSA